MQDFHHYRLEPWDDIVNYDDRLEMQTCELDNLAQYAHSFILRTKENRR